jgi:hypothetical protein
MIINGEVKFFMVGKCSFALSRFFEGKPVGSIPINNKMKFNELSARTGGALITRVYEKLFDLNIEETNYLIQLGLINNVCVNKKDVYAGFLNFPYIKGCVDKVEEPQLNITHEFIKFVEKGNVLRQAENLLDISCSVIFWDKSYQKVESTFEYLKNFTPLVVKDNIEKLNVN